MDETTTTTPDETTSSAAAGSSTVTTVVEADLVETELLVEEISIDGMCGVY